MGGFSVVQTVSATFTAEEPATFSVALPNSVTAGNSLMVVGLDDAGYFIATQFFPPDSGPAVEFGFTDSQGNQYGPNTNYPTPGEPWWQLYWVANYDITVAYAWNVKPGITSWTFYLNNTAVYGEEQVTVIIAELAGIGVADPNNIINYYFPPPSGPLIPTSPPGVFISVAANYANTPAGIMSGPESVLIDSIATGSDPEQDGPANLLVQYALAPTLASTYEPTASGPTGSNIQIAGSVFFFPTSTPATGIIVVSKNTVPPGSPQPFSFLPSWGAPFSLTDGQSNNSGPLPAGSYYISEVPVIGWYTAASPYPGDIVVLSGETTNVQFINTQAVQVIVNKTTNPAGNSQEFDFMTNYGPPFSLAGGQSNNSGFLPAGTYTVAEAPLPGWQTVSTPFPPTITLTPGQTGTIDFLNKYVVGCLTPLWMTDEFASQANQPGWQQNPGTPEAFSVVAPPPLQVQLVPPPINIGFLDLLTVNSGADLDPSVGVELGIPTNFAWVAKYGALAALLSQDGEPRDDFRAGYCRQRYEEGCDLARRMPVVVTAALNGVQVFPQSVAELDAFRPTWECEVTPPDAVACAGQNLVAACPPPGTSPVSMTLDVVQNAVVPEADTEFLQIGREFLQVILGEAEHLALFKSGGSEFGDSVPLHQAFVMAAATCNDRLKASSIYLNAIAAQSESEKKLRPRRETDDEQENK